MVGANGGSGGGGDGGGGGGRPRTADDILFVTLFNGQGHVLCTNIIKVTTYLHVAYIM